MHLSYRELAFEVASETLTGHACVTEWSGKQTWYLDAEVVRWLVGRISAGKATADEVAKLLERKLQWDSGCCWACDQAFRAYPEALRRYDEALGAWQAEQARMTPESHPYLLNRGRIHAWNCPRAGKPRPPRHPGDLHRFAVFYDSLNRDLDRVLDELGEDTLICRRATVADISQRLARRNPHARDPRCKQCLPELPGAWSSETTDAPLAP